MRTLLFTCCGGKLVYDELRIVDGDKLPISKIWNIGGIEIENVLYPINQIFSGDVALLSYLNTTFATIPSPKLRSKWKIDSTGLYYGNIEQFNQGEIMISYGLKHLVCPVGAAPAITTTADATFANGSSFSSPMFLNMKAVQVRMGNSDVEPLAASGYTYTKVDPGNPLNGLFTFSNVIEDINLYFTLTDTPA